MSDGTKRLGKARGRGGTVLVSAIALAEAKPGGSTGTKLTKRIDLVGHHSSEPIRSPVTSPHRLNHVLQERGHVRPRPLRRFSRRTDTGHASDQPPVPAVDPPAFVSAMRPLAGGLVMAQR